MSTFEGNSFAGETVFGTFYPRGYIVAVTHERGDAEAALAALARAGFGEARIWTAQEVQERHQAFLAQRSVLQRIEAALAADEKLALEDYLQAAREGHTFLTVHVPDRQQVEQARTVLAAYHAHQMHYYGDTAMVDLLP